MYNSSAPFKILKILNCIAIEQYGKVNRYGAKPSFARADMFACHLVMYIDNNMI